MAGSGPDPVYDIFSVQPPRKARLTSSNRMNDILLEQFQSYRAEEDKKARTNTSRRKRAKENGRGDEAVSPTKVKKEPLSVPYTRAPNSLFVPEIDPKSIVEENGQLRIVASDSNQFKFVRKQRYWKGNFAPSDIVKRVIDAVRRRPIIWDQRLLNHSRQGLVKQAWNEIADELGTDEQYTLRRYKQIWKNKKDYFINTTAGGSNLSNWEYYQDLVFYLPCVNYRLKHTLPTTEDNNKGISERHLFSPHVTFNEGDQENVLKYLLHTFILPAHKEGSEELEATLDHMVETFCRVAAVKLEQASSSLRRNKDARSRNANPGSDEDEEVDVEQ